MMRLLKTKIALELLVSYFLFCLPGLSQANNVHWNKISPEIEMKKFRLATSNFNQFIDIFAFRAEASHFHIVCGQPHYTDEWRINTKALLAVNGGFFDKHNQSLGLRISQSNLVCPLLQNAWSVFTIENGQAAIVPRTEIKKNKNISEAIQCSPLLVFNCQVLPLKLEKARRTGIGIQNDGRVVLAICTRALSLPDWANFWKQDLHCIQAINLDGGPSTQLSVKTNLKSLEISGGWPVPDAVIIK